MSKKTLIAISLIALAFFFTSGCKKVDTKSQVDYQADAKKEITQENMDTELEKIEKSMEAEISQVE